MKVRADVAELLRAGLSDRAIGRQLSTDPKAVAAARRALGLPKAKSGVRPAATVEDLFHARTRPVEGGHVEWLGHVNATGVPALRHGGRQHTAYRVAFRIHNRRDPVGYAGPGCGMARCVAPAHMDDAPAREKNRATYRALFGGTQ